MEDIKSPCIQICRADSNGVCFDVEEPTKKLEIGHYIPTNKRRKS